MLTWVEPRRRNDAPRWLLLVVVGCGLLTGCRSRTVTLDESISQEGETVRNSCEEILHNAATMLQPDRLGVSTDRGQVVDLLNQWYRDCKPEVPDKSDTTSAALLTAAGGETSPDTLDDIQINGRDVDHVRNCILAKKLGEALARSADRDLDRVNLLFDWVVRNISLKAGAPRNLPLTPFEIALFGQGTAQDRAWLFVEMLRTLRIDAVILESSNVAEESQTDKSPVVARPFLVGVLLDEPGHPVYLYDPELGTPVPGPGIQPLLPRPATIQEVLAEPALLDGLVEDDASRPRLKAEDLKSPRVLVSTNYEFNRSRTQLLQRVLPVEMSAYLFDPLGDAEGLPGALKRISAAGWDAKTLAVWPYPVQKLDEFEKLTETQQNELALLRVPFQAPLAVVETVEGGLKFGRPTRQLLTTRISQLLGDRQLAVRSFQVIRTDGNFPANLAVPAEIREMHRLAEENAFFWTGLLQYEGGDFAAAATSLADFIGIYPNSHWVHHARGVLARSLARSGKFALAVQVLNDVAPEDPEKAGHLLLQRRCRELRESAKTSQLSPSREPGEQIVKGTAR